MLNQYRAKSPPAWAVRERKKRTAKRHQRTLHSEIMPRIGPMPAHAANNEFIYRTLTYR